VLSPRVHRAFFGPFRGQLRPIQQIAIERLHGERDALVIAGTGSGKTEAVLAPVAEGLLESEAQAASSSRLRALIISPTRALASDLHRRMVPIFEALGLRLDVATSDLRTMGSTPTDILIRTPEGLDRHLCTQGDSLTGILYVVIDEMHQFLNDPRGTQLAGLLTRLTKAAPPHRRIGISATVSDKLAPVGMRLLRDPIIVEDPSETGSVEIHYHRWMGSDEQAATRFLRELRELGVQKAVGFVGKRDRAERVSNLLARDQYRGRSFAHHAALSSAERRKIEEVLRKLPVALVVATKTLEVGIDIGNLDTCILFDPPPDHESYLQRIGRAGRRSGVRRVICVHDLFDRKREFVRVVEPALNRATRSDHRPFLAGCFQQVMSFVATHGARPVVELRWFWQDAFGLDESLLSRLISICVDNGWLIESDGIVETGPKLRALESSGQLHLTFSGTVGTPLIDESTGRTLGYVALQPGGSILLGGSGRKITGFDAERGAAISVPTETGEARFVRAGLSVFERLAHRHERYFGGKVRVE